jgi:hypothetical protein
LDQDELIDKLKEVLSDAGLTSKPSKQRVTAFREQKERERDMEGISSKGWYVETLDSIASYYW